MIFHRFLYVYQKRVELPFFMVKDGAPKALKHAPMSLVIVMRNASPLAALMMERFYPEPIRISRAMVAAIVTLGLSFVSGGISWCFHWIFVRNCMVISFDLF